MASIDREHPEFMEEIQRRERAEEKARMDHKFHRSGKQLRERCEPSKLVRVSFGKCWDGEAAPLGHRFRTPFGTQDIFNNITRRYPGAKDWKKRFAWHDQGGVKFWYTQDAQSAQEAIKELEQRGYVVHKPGMAT